jgi:hypothetical protein
VSSQERYEQRDRVYSNWHRQACARTSPMIDVDGLDYCLQCYTPVLLVEAARDVGQTKPTVVLKSLAVAANVQAICVMWTPTVDGPLLPPHCRCQRERRRYPDCDHGMASARVQRIWPEPSDFVVMSPAQLAAYIDNQHHLHVMKDHSPFGVQQAA